MYDFSEMSADQLIERKNELLAELDNAETRDALSTDDLESRKAEITAIDAELEARKETARKAEEARKAVEAGAGITKEEHQEEKKMEMSEIRNSPEYLNAYANYVKTGRDDECRAVLLSKNASASGQVPVPDMLEDIIKTAWERNEFLNRVRKTYFRGNLRVPFELSATGA